MGHTTDVPLNQRISIWIELVPLLLAHLGIQHVALGSHSAGTLYMLNTLAHWRDILDPENPLVISLGKSFPINILARSPMGGVIRLVHER